MSDFSIAEVKSRLAELVRQAETGQAVRITRRGQPVAVLLSDAEYERLLAPREGWLAFTQQCRSEAAAQGMMMFEESDWAGLRDQSERPATDLS